MKKILKKILALTISSVALQGCSTFDHDSRTPFQKEGLGIAIYELECSKDKLNVIPLGGASYGVMGCGKKAIYVGPGENGFTRTSEIEFIK